MKQFTVSENEEGRRLDKYIRGILKEAPQSFAYKMLRKKNIVLNGKKAGGGETLHTGDTVSFYLSDETFSRFSASFDDSAAREYKLPPIVYEDDDIIIADKPSGMLAQKSSAGDISLNEILLSYAKECNTDASFCPSICNRLDRNTSGLITFAKTLKGAQYLNESFKRRTIEKYYTCIVAGIVDRQMTLSGKLVKDSKTNTVIVNDTNGEGADITTVIKPLRNNSDLCMLEVELITGKTHQIRAHLASIGHPIAGDVKYGNRKLNERLLKEFGIKYQMLKCTRMVFPDDGVLAVSGQTVYADIPGSFKKVM